MTSFKVVAFTVFLFMDYQTRIHLLYYRLKYFRVLKFVILVLDYGQCRMFIMQS